MRKKRTRKPWTEADKQYLRHRYPDVPTWKIAKEMGRNTRSIYSTARDMGLKKSDEFKNSPLAGRIQPGSDIGGATKFCKGHKPHNKGVKGWQAGGKSGETKFKKGSKPHNWKPVGSLRVTKEGILQRKMTNTGYPPKDWKSVHSMLWESHYGPVKRRRRPDGHQPGQGGSGSGPDNHQFGKGRGRFSENNRGGREQRLYPL